MNSTLSLNDCAKRLADTVRGPRFELFLDLRPGVSPKDSPGRFGSCYFTTGGHCLGQALPETAAMMRGFIHRGFKGNGMMLAYSAS